MISLKPLAASPLRAAILLAWALWATASLTPLPAAGEEPRDGGKDAVSLCAPLAVPGDMLLIHTGSTGFRKAVNQAFVDPAGDLDLLALNDPVTKFFHAEIIREIDGEGRMSTVGFYPLEKKYRTDQYLSSAAVYRVKGPVSVQEGALRKVSGEEYGQTGFCGDYVAWAYEDGIYSWWNVVPGLRDVFLLLYPPEAIHTPDDLANSPQTVMVCEVRNGEIVFPDRIETEALAADLDRFMESSNALIAGHAGFVRTLLERDGAVDASGKILKERISFPFTLGGRGPLATR